MKVETKNEWSNEEEKQFQIFVQRFKTIKQDNIELNSDGKRGLSYNMYYSF